MPITVTVADNFHYMDRDEHYSLGEFETVEAAIAAAKRVVDEYLASAIEPGMSASALYFSYMNFGEDPFLSGDGSDFSAWDYAKARCEELCAGATVRPPYPDFGRPFAGPPMDFGRGEKQIAFSADDRKAMNTVLADADPGEWHQLALCHQDPGCLFESEEEYLAADAAGDLLPRL